MTIGPVLSIILICPPYIHVISRMNSCQMQIQTCHSVLKPANPLAKIPILWHGFGARLFMIWSTHNISSFVTNHFTSRRLEGFSLSPFKGQMIFTWKHTHVSSTTLLPQYHPPTLLTAYSILQVSLRWYWSCMKPFWINKNSDSGSPFPCPYIILCTNTQLFIYIVASSSRLEVPWRKRVNKYIAKWKHGKSLWPWSLQ